MRPVAVYGGVTRCFCGAAIGIGITTIGHCPCLLPVLELRLLLLQLLVGIAQAGGALHILCGVYKVKSGIILEQTISIDTFMNNKHPKDANGRPLNGINTAKRSSNLGGNNKRKKANASRADNDFLQSRAEKERLLREKKLAAEAKLAAKKKAREEARLLDIQLGFSSVSIDDNEDDGSGKHVDKMHNEGSVSSEPLSSDASSAGTGSCSRYQGQALTWGAYLARGVF